MRSGRRWGRWGPGHWPDPRGPAEKLAEETQELDEALEADKLEEAGDLLFSAVNLVRAYGIAAEDALRAANSKFERRFREVERIVASRGLEMSGIDLDAMEEVWQEVKRQESDL